MELRSILSADHLDIIFDGRNKNYGGYELRKNYSRRAMRSITVVLSTALLLIGAHAIASSFKPDEVVKSPLVNRPTDITPVTYDPPKPEVVVPVQGRVAATVTNPPPKIVADNEQTVDPPTKDDLDGKEIGPVNTAGNGGDVAAVSEILSEGPGIPTPSFVEPPKSEAPMEYVEQMPEFNGDLSAYLGNNIQYPLSAREAGITGKVTIQFVVNEDGSVSNAKVIRAIGGGCEEEAIRVINAMPKWKAGRQNGKAVKVFYTLPVKFTMN